MTSDQAEQAIADALASASASSSNTSTEVHTGSPSGMGEGNVHHGFSEQTTQNEVFDFNQLDVGHFALNAGNFDISLMQPDNAWTSASVQVQPTDALTGNISLIDPALNAGFTASFAQNNPFTVGLPALDGCNPAAFSLPPVVQMGAEYAELDQMGVNQIGIDQVGINQVGDAPNAINPMVVNQVNLGVVENGAFNNALWTGEHNNGMFYGANAGFAWDPAYLPLTEEELADLDINTWSES